MSFDVTSYAMGKQARGGGGVTVEPLSVTENGTYTAPSGKAYSPVTAKIRQGIPINISTHINPETGEWERPAGWPDLDSITLGQDTDIDELYMTYDLSKTEGWGWIGLGATTTGNVDWTIERGHLSGTQFVADEAFTVASNGFFRQELDSTKGNIQLWRMRGYRITKYGFASNSSNTAENFDNFLQPCVEVAGRLGFVTNLSSTINTTGTAECIGTVWMERWSVDVDTGAVTNMGSMFGFCYSLQSLDMSGWDTSVVTGMSSMFYNCYSLQSLDVSGWDTGAVTGMNNMFSGCYSLQELDVSGWDTGAVTSMNSMFNGCYSLQELDVSGWDTGAVTSMSSMFNGCYSLQSLDMSGWDTSVVTGMSSMFYNCYSLQSLDVSGWDTGAVTGMNNMFSGCYSLQSLDAEEIDISRLANNTPDLNLANLVTLYPLIISTNQNFNTATKLSVDSLIRIVNSLPTVTSTRTLTLGQPNRLKLTAEEIAVATEKGWTVA